MSQIPAGIIRLYNIEELCTAMGRPVARKKQHKGDKPLKEKYRTRHRTKDHDQIHFDLEPKQAAALLQQTVDYDVTGNAQHYCLHCAQYFITEQASVQYSISSKDWVDYRCQREHRMAAVSIRQPHKIFMSENSNYKCIKLCILLLLLPYFYYFKSDTIYTQFSIFYAICFHYNLKYFTC